MCWSCECSNTSHLSGIHCPKPHFCRAESNGRAGAVFFLILTVRISLIWPDSAPSRAHADQKTYLHFGNSQAEEKSYILKSRKHTQHGFSVHRKRVCTWLWAPADSEAPVYVLGNHWSSSSGRIFLPLACGGQTRFTAKTALFGPPCLSFQGVGCWVSFSPASPQKRHTWNTSDTSQPGVTEGPQTVASHPGLPFRFPSLNSVFEGTVLWKTSSALSCPPPQECCAVDLSIDQRFQLSLTRTSDTRHCIKLLIVEWKDPRAAAEIKTISVSHQCR